MAVLLVLLLLIPIIAGLIAFALPPSGSKVMAMLASLCTLGISAYLATTGIEHSFVREWIPTLGAQWALAADSMAIMLSLLTGIVFVILLLANWNKEVHNGCRFYALLLLAQGGLLGVFLASDMLLFYLFWELALIPVYFLCSIWGGEKRIAVTFKFFVYTFIGSLLMLSGILYLHSFNNGAAAYSIQNIISAGNNLPASAQVFWFALMFLAFAIKMPIFPFHTWQPDTYEQSPTPVTIVLSALMVKMGVYGVLRWVLPVLPEGVAYWANTVIILSIIGIIYASCIALVQDDLKRLVAYSSIAHMGLISAGVFMQTDVAMHGVMVQMFNHGINITGMWVIISMIENRYGTRKMSELGGMAGAVPWMSVALLIIAFANIALPLTNGFVGEFMLFHGIFQSDHTYHIGYMVLAGLGIILGAVYTLTMVAKVAFGQAPAGKVVSDFSLNEWVAVIIIIGLIVFLGVYPMPLLQLTSSVVG